MVPATPAPPGPEQHQDQQDQDEKQNDPGHSLLWLLARWRWHCLVLYTPCHFFDNNQGMEKQNMPGNHSSLGLYAAGGGGTPPKFPARWIRGPPCKKMMARAP